MNLKSNLVLHARLAGFVLLIECVAFLAWSRWFWTPIQVHYMRAYVYSSLAGKAPDSDFKIGWIFKTAPGGKRELAIEDDAVRAPYSEHDRTGMELSQTARQSGWTSLLEGPPERIPAARLRAILSDQIFEGQSVWVFVLLPAMIGFAGAIFLLQCFVWLDDWLPEMPWRRQRFPWEEPAPTAFDRFGNWVKRIRSRIACLRWRAIQRPTTHLSESTIVAPVKQAAENPTPIAFPVFGIKSRSSARVYVWSERDEID